MWLDFKLWIAWQSTVNTAYCIRCWAHSFPSFLVAKGCFYYSPLLCYEFSYIWEMPSCQLSIQQLNTDPFGHGHNKQHVNARGQSLHYIKLHMDLSFYGFSWNKSHYSTWQKNCTCIYQHVWPAFPQSTIKPIFKVN